MRLVKIKSREIAWQATLSLWEELSKVDVRITTNPVDHKQRVARALGYDIRPHNCPLCALYHDTSLCPIALDVALSCTKKYNPCLRTSYREWQYVAWNNGRNDARLARAFYVYLLDLRTRDAVRDSKNSNDNKI